MSVYAIGDVQGCYPELMALLEQIQFDVSSDSLWFTGDLVNRGPQSLEVLRFVMSLGSRAVTVLGNHDLHLLAVAYDPKSRPRRKDTFHDVLDAPDRDELLSWLRHQPLLHYDPDLDFALLHAGLPPQWDLPLAQNCARQVEAIISSDDHVQFWRHMYGDKPALWKDDLKYWKRLRFITNCLTRLRYCRLDGALELDEKGPPGNQSAGLVPWFEVPDRRSRDTNIIFGHWSTLILAGGSWKKFNVHPLDTGCLWGGELTAMRLEDQILTGVPALRKYRSPGFGEGST